MKKIFILLFVMLFSCVFSSSTLANENALSDEDVQAIEDGERVAADKADASDSRDDVKVGFKRQVYCVLGGPAQVQGYRVQCRNASYIDFSIADCCIPGDHWQLKAKNWDRAPNTAVTTSPGAVLNFSTPARTYNYGGTPNNRGNMDTFLECTMLHGVDVFAAGAYVNVVSDASNCSITREPIRSRIDRSP